MERRHTSTCCAARIERAKDLLRSTGLSVTEVSLEVGFRSLGSFSTAFRDLVGESPSEYAHRWRAAGAPRDDCQKTYAELNERGVNFLSEPTERFYGIEATLRDNSGNWFSMTQRSETDREGITVTPDGDEVELTVPLNLAFGNPALLRAIGLTPVLRSLGAERQYKNDEQIDNSLRSVLFQVPKPGVSDPAACGSPVVSPDCFTGVQDLGAIDIQRGRDHGMPSYNDLRRASGRSARSPPSREKRPTASRAAQRSTIPTSSTSSSSATPLGMSSRWEATPGGRGRRHPPYDAGRSPEGDLRKSRKAGRVRGNGVGATRPRNGVRGAPARDLEAAVPGTARRRQVLLPERSSARRDQAAVRARLPPDAREHHPAEHRQRPPGKRVRGPSRLV